MKGVLDEAARNEVITLIVRVAEVSENDARQLESLLWKQAKSAEHFWLVIRNPEAIKARRRLFLANEGNRVIGDEKHHNEGDVLQEPASVSDEGSHSTVSLPSLPRSEPSKFIY